MKKMLAMLLAVALTAGMMAGCGTGAGSSTGTAKKEQKQEEQKKEEQTGQEGQAGGSGEKQEVVMWGSMSGDAVTYVNQIIETYNGSQDKYHVTYSVQDSMEEKLITAIAGGEVPDIVMWDRFTTGTYAAKGAFYPLDDFVQTDGMDLTQFYEPAVNEMKGRDGKLYGIPLTVDTRIIFYNKDLLAEAGVDPTSIKTWDDLRAAAVAATKRDADGKLSQAGFALSDPGLFNNWILQAGGKMIDDTQTPPVTAFNSQEGLAVLNYWNQLLKEDKVYELGFEDSFGGNGFKAGKVAICFNGPWALKELSESGINYGVLEQPQGPGGVKSAIMGGFGLVIPSKASNIDAAWDFIKWWTTNKENGVEFAKLSSNLPANKNAAADPYFMDNEILSVFSATMLYATTRMQVPGYSDVEGLALRPQLDLFASGQITAEEALSKAQKQGDDILKEAAAE